jgi:hypothetical protein
VKTSRSSFESEPMEHAAERFDGSYLLLLSVYARRSAAVALICEDLQLGQTHFVPSEVNICPKIKMKPAR